MSQGMNSASNQGRQDDAAFAPNVNSNQSTPPADAAPAPTPAAATPTVAPSPSPADATQQAAASQCQGCQQCGNGAAAPASADAAESAPPQVQCESQSNQPLGPGVVVRYGAMGHLGLFRHNLQTPPKYSTKVVIRTDRGVEIGQVMAIISDQPDGMMAMTPARLDDYIRANGPEFPFRRNGRILRIANNQDLIEHRHLKQSASEAASFCRQHIRELKLDMKLVTVEYLLGGERILFHFKSEARIDFRELVRRLANQFHTRVEMRQVGARDEARLVGDYERCGQRCCCQQYMKDLKPVSMRMAKMQKATLDPTKISGRCGRLMCCMRYEDEVYVDLKKNLPRKNTWIRTEKLAGKVLDGQILTQLVRILLPDWQQAVVAIEEIVERDIAPLPMANQEDQRPHRGGDRRSAAGAKKPAGSPSGGQTPAGSQNADVGQAADVASAGDTVDGDDLGGDELATTDEQAAAMQKGQADSQPRQQDRRDQQQGRPQHQHGRRDQNRNQRPGGGQNQGQNQNRQQQSGQNQQGQQGQNQGRGRRRRRGRRGGGQNQGGQNNGGQNNRPNDSGGAPGGQNSSGQNPPPAPPPSSPPLL